MGLIQTSFVEILLVDHDGRLYIPMDLRIKLLKISIQRPVSNRYERPAKKGK